MLAAYPTIALHFTTHAIWLALAVFVLAIFVFYWSDDGLPKSTARPPSQAERWWSGHAFGSAATMRQSGSSPPAEAAMTMMLFIPGVI